MTYKDCIIEASRRNGMPDERIELCIAKATAQFPNAKLDYEIPVELCEKVILMMRLFHLSLRHVPEFREEVQERLAERLAARDKNN